jgi:hypothetical protein
MTDTSDRLQIPMLAVGQAQKEVTHNEALARIDILLQPVVQAVAPATVPAAPLTGQSWIVGPSPSGHWAGQANNVASWTTGGWRFMLPIEGMTFWSVADSTIVRRQGTAWLIGSLTAAILKIGGNQVVGARQPAIVTPTGGTITDSESRAAISAILATMRTHGLIQT